jgi:hypothetical protein
MGLTVTTEDLTKHKAKCLIFNDPKDFPDKLVKALEVRYPGILQTYLDLCADPKFLTGNIAPFIWEDQDGDPSTVIFINGKDPIIGDTTYLALRACLEKIGQTYKTHKCNSFAVVQMGKGRVRSEALQILLEIYLKNIPDNETYYYQWT